MKKINEEPPKKDPNRFNRAVASGLLKPDGSINLDSKDLIFKWREEKQK